MKKFLLSLVLIFGIFLPAFSNEEELIQNNEENEEEVLQEDEENEEETLEDKIIEENVDKNDEVKEVKYILRSGIYPKKEHNISKQSAIKNLNKYKIELSKIKNKEIQRLNFEREILNFGN